MNSSIAMAIVLFIVVVLFWLVMAYSGFKRMLNSSSEAFRAVTMCYEARRKTCENLVRLADNYVKDADLQFVMDAVSAADKAEQPADIIAAEIGVSDAAVRMREVLDGYVEFASSKRYIKLRDELELDDRNIAVTIRIYNTIAKNYNEKVHGIMTKFAAKLCGFKEIPMI